MKNEIITYCAIGCLIAAFFVISILVYLTKGNASLISKKLKLGALILTLSASLSGCYDDPADPYDGRTCYLAPPPDDIYLEMEFSKDAGVIDLTQSDEIFGKISFRESERFSFSIVDKYNNKLWQVGEINAADGKFDEDSEEFVIKIDKNIEPGLYFVNLFNRSVIETIGQAPTRQYPVKILK